VKTLIKNQEPIYTAPEKLVIEKYAPLFNLNVSQLAKPANLSSLKAALEDKVLPSKESERLLYHLARVTFQSANVNKLFPTFGFVIDEMSPMQKKQLLMTWPAAKKRKFADAYSAFLASKDEGSNNTSL
jgi:hypothetical protein